jgi:hypothetical protein
METEANPNEQSRDAFRRLPGRLFFSSCTTASTLSSAAPSALAGRDIGDCKPLAIAIDSSLFSIPDKDEFRPPGEVIAT